MREHAWWCERAGEQSPYLLDFNVKSFFHDEQKNPDFNQQAYDKRVKELQKDK